MNCLILQEHTLTHIKHQLEDWIKISTAKNVSGLAIVLANLNIRKGQMILAVRGEIKAHHKPRNRIALGKLRHLCLKRDNFKCRECGVSKDVCPLEIDHITPYSKGGLTELDNLQTLCRQCNNCKSARIW